MKQPSGTKPIGLLVYLPTRGAVTIETVLCLREHLDGYPNKLLTAFRKPLVEARNFLAKEAREIKPDDFDPGYVLWVDDDAWWPAGTVNRAVQIMEQRPDLAMVSGLFCVRKAYAEVRALTLAWKPVPLLGAVPGELIELRLAGGHWFLLRRDVLSRLSDTPFDLMPIAKVFPSLPGFARHWDPGEDLSFAARVFAVGKIVTERSLLIGHLNAKTGLCFFPGQAPRIANGLDAPYYPDHAITEAAYEERSYFSETDGDDVWQADIQGAA